MRIETKKTIAISFIFFVISGLFFVYQTLGKDIKISITLRKEKATLQGESHLPVKQHFAEIEELQSKKRSYDELKVFFEAVADNKGARYGLELLKAAPIPPDVDLHLLGHVVGDKLYKQEGSQGITVCTNDFRNACSHSIVVGLFYDKGDEALPEISEACRKAPGGSGAYAMCFHGLGHGILAYGGYEMEKAIAMCDKTGTKEFVNQEIAQCVGGGVMEIISGGFHDRYLWQKERKKTLIAAKPLSLCQNTVPTIAKTMCYMYITPFLFEASGGGLRPNQAQLKVAFAMCEVLPKTNRNRQDCFGGFGKEFIALVQDRDIRQKSLENMPEASLTHMHELCSLAVDKEDIRSCIIYAMNSLYWGGENDRSLPIRFCKAAQDAFFEANCFQSLIGSVRYYVKDQNYRKAFCSEIPYSYKNECESRMQS